MPARPNLLAVILGGGAGSRLFPLTQLRSKPAVPLGGKYRLVDIPISNCINSDVIRMFVLTQFNSASLNKHIATTYRFSPFADGFVEIIAAEQTPERPDWFQGTADAVRQVMVRVATSEAALVNNRDMPDICMQHMVAVMLVDKTASFAAAHDKPRMQDPRILKAREKIQLVPDAALEALLPKRIAVVEITFADGSRVSERVEAVRGTAENPMTREEVVAKCRDLLSPVLGASKSARLIDAVLGLESVKDVRTLRPLLQRS